MTDRPAGGLVVATRRGRVRGTVEGDVRVFRGIPFARPPVGPRRFGPPEAPEPWSDVRDATGTLATSEIGAIAGRTPAAEALSGHMQDAWLAFARSGRPRATGLPEWPTYAAPRRATLILSDRPRVVDAPQEAERAVWDSLLE